MEVTVARRSGTLATARDLVALGKPRVTMLVLVTTAGGAWLAPGTLSHAAAISLLVGTALVVGGANALNMFLERDSDAKMTRTKDRPLAAGRLSPEAGLAFGLATSALSIPILALGVNATTALFAALANLLYVLAYTPLKRRSHLALLVGSVPGAIPPVLGWTARTSRVDAGALVLFAILYLWQLPHFYAIATFRRAEYERAGLRVSTSRAAEATRTAILASIAALTAVSVLLVPLGIAGTAYAAVAIALGLAFFVVALSDARRKTDGRATFYASLAYLVVLFASLAFLAT